MCRIVQSLAEQPVIGLVQQLLKVRQIGRAVAVTFTASKERVDSFEVRKYSTLVSPQCNGNLRKTSRINLIVCFKTCNFCLCCYYRRILESCVL